MTTAEAVAREVEALKKNIDTNRLFEGEVTVTRQYDKSKCSFEVTIAPSKGNHREGEYDFQIVIKCRGSPQIYCQTDIFHPNINTINGDGKVCINLEQDYSAQVVVEKLLDLMHNPVFSNSHLEIDSSDSAEVAKFWDDTQTSIAGGTVDGYLFPMNARYARLHPDN